MTTNFNHILIIARNEFKAIAGKKSFIVMTILIPVLSIACLGLPYLLMQFNKGEIETVAIVDHSGRYGNAITDNDEFHFQLYSDTPTQNIHDFYNEQTDLYAIAIIPADVDSTLAVDIFSNNAVRMGLQEHLAECLNDTITQARINSYGIPMLNKIIEESSAEVNVNCIKWDDDGSESQSNAEIASIIGMALAFLTYIFVLMYGAMILTSVTEEKTNRIVEVMMSCCRPIELLSGKIIGIGMVGIVQIAIWCVCLGIISVILGISSAIFNPEVAMVQAQAMSVEADNETMTSIMQAAASINFVEIIACFVLYFIGGYLLYGSLFAAAGSTVDQASEGSQAVTPLMTFLMLSLWAGIACMENPDGNLAWWCSMIPFTSPIVMMVRLPYDVAFWEIALSIIILYASAWGFSVIAAKIYRNSILRYGQKFSWKNLGSLLK